MHFTSPNTNFPSQRALPWTPVKGFAPGLHQEPIIGGLDPTHGFLRSRLALRPLCFSLQAIPKSWKPCNEMDKMWHARDTGVLKSWHRAKRCFTFCSFHRAFHIGVKHWHWKTLSKARMLQHWFSWPSLVVIEHCLTFLTPEVPGDPGPPIRVRLL